MIQNYEPIAKRVSLRDIEKGIIPKSKSPHLNPASDADVVIAVYESNKKVSENNRKKILIARFNFYNAVFKEYEYITFYRKGNTLYFSLTDDDNDGQAYKISRKGDSRSTQVQGGNAQYFKAFVGRHQMNIYKYNYYDVKLPTMYYIKRYDEEAAE